MKRSRAVPLTLVASASSLAACGKQEPLQCVERGTNRVVAESLCVATNAPTAATPAVGDSSRAVRHAGGGIPPVFLWYYGGRMASGLMTGGGYAPLAGRRYRSPGGLAFRSGQGWSRARSVGAPSGSSAGRSRGAGTVRGGFGGIGAGRSMGG